MKKDLNNVRKKYFNIYTYNEKIGMWEFFCLVPKNENVIKDCIIDRLKQLGHRVKIQK